MTDSERSSVFSQSVKARTLPDCQIKVQPDHASSSRAPFPAVLRSEGGDERSLSLLAEYLKLASAIGTQNRQSLPEMFEPVTKRLNDRARVVDKSHKALASSLMSFLQQKAFSEAPMSISLPPRHLVPVHYLVSPNASLFLMLPWARCLGFGLLLTLLHLNSGTLYAEWVALEKTAQFEELQTVYVDPATIQRDGNLVTLWHLNDFKVKQGNVGFAGGSQRYSSTKTHKQFDCAEKRVRLLAYMEFSDHMGIGIRNDGYVDQDNWQPVEPNSINQGLWEVACNKE